MTERSQVYKCQLCGNIVEVVHAAAGQLVCCNQPMTLLAENTTDAATEKHVPVVELVDGNTKVTVGSVTHPMTDDHYIEWIELLIGDRVFRTYLSPGDSPEAVFEVVAEGTVAREYCNLHGLWRTEA